MSKVISPFVVSTRRRVRDSFTLVEILVVIAIIAILAGVALPAITGAIKKANENAAMQTARGLELGCFQYANDNSQIYPTASDGTSVSFFASLTNGYVANTDALWISGASGTKFTSGNLTAQNVSWDATVTGSTNGLSPSDPDQTPVIMSTGSTVSYGAAGTATNATAILAAGNSSPFVNDGIAVAYKSGSAAFEHCTIPGQAFYISSASFDPANTYLQVDP